MAKAAKIILKTAVFAACLALVVAGQKQIGVPGLLAMLAGLAGLLWLLFSYNKKYS